MKPALKLERETWPLAQAFRISRGSKSAAEVVVVEISASGDGREWLGRGECVPYARYGESSQSVMDAVASAWTRLDVGSADFDGIRGQVQAILPACAARNALDAALWDLQSRRRGCGVAELLGLQPTSSIETACTISLDSPERMAASARQLAAFPLIKVKVDAHDPAAQLAAVHAAAPAAQLIVDANEGWSFPLLQAMQEPLRNCGAVLLEQPLPAAEDALLERFTPLVPICADESCHTMADLPRLRDRYQAINVKLDKSGGLTAAHELVHAAVAANMQVMLGCMVCTSLGIAPVLLLARHAHWLDLDGPLLLAADRPGGVTLLNGRLQPPQPGFWGDGLPWRTDATQGA